jgi:glycosyltransferase involved in cell wall biosynthesis
MREINGIVSRAISRPPAAKAEEIAFMSAESPKVSIIIPCYNRADTIGETLASVHEQTCADWEALVIDDGSRDKSLEIAQQWAARDRRIRALTQTNEGPAAARNRGVKESQGKWLSFLDADDLYPRQFVEHMLAAAEVRSSPQPHFCGMRLITEDGKRVLGSTAAQGSWGFKELAHTNPFAIHAVMVPRRVFTEIGTFDASLVGCEDWDMWARAARAGCEFVPVHGCEVDYRMRASSRSSDFLRRYKACLDILHRTHRPDPRCMSPSSAYKDGCREEHLDELCRMWALKMFERSVVYGDRHAARSLLQCAGRGTPALSPDDLGNQLAGELFALPIGFSRFAQNWNVIAELVQEFAQQEVGDRRAKKYSSDVLFSFADIVRRRWGMRLSWRGFASSLRSAPWACAGAAGRLGTQAVVRRLSNKSRRAAQNTSG